MATKEFFPGIEKIKFEGKDSKNRWHSVTTMLKRLSTVRR